MSIPTNVQFIEQNGKPAFAIIPYEDYLSLVPKQEATIPHEVVGLVIKNNWNLVKAWRNYLGFSKVFVAENSQFSVIEISQLEKQSNQTTSRLLEKVANAMQIDSEQLID